MAVWPDLDLDACAAELTELQGDWMRLLASLDEEELRESVGYRNSKGEFWTSTVADILTHVALHASYHGGRSPRRSARPAPATLHRLHPCRAHGVGRMTSGSPGPLLVALGIGLVILGLLVWSGALGWFGRLPGDIRIERDWLEFTSRS